MGHLISQTYPSGVQIAYGYDAQGRINSLTLNNQPFSLPKTWLWGNGTNYSRSFDNDGRLSSYPLDADTRIMTYDAAGRISAYTQNAISNNRVVSTLNLKEKKIVDC